jgi:hypothetical protein
MMSRLTDFKKATTKTQFRTGYTPGVLDCNAVGREERPLDLSAPGPGHQGIRGGDTVRDGRACS